MPPKKQKSTEDIRSFFNQETVSPGGSSSTKSTQPEEAATSQTKTSCLVKVKKEEEEDGDFKGVDASVLQTLPETLNHQLIGAHCSKAKMLPRKRKSTEDIRSFFNQETVSPGGSSSTMNTQPEKASTSHMKTLHLVSVKKEEEDDTDFKQSPHSHQFKVKFPNDSKKYTVDCDQACTVLEAIRSHLNEPFRMMMTKDKKRNYFDEKIIIQRSKKGKESIVATHFPCSCIENGECLVIHYRTEEVQETKNEHDKILPRENYSVFYISKEGGVNAKKRKLFRSKTVKEFDFLCVYAKKGASVKEALEKDGRFVDLEDFKLSEVANAKQHTLCTQKVNSLDQKIFKISLPKQKTAKAKNANEQTNSEQQEQQKQQKQPSTSKQSQRKVDTKSVLDAAQKSGISVKRAMEEKGSEVNTEELYKLLCKQFPHLKTWMENRFPGDSYQKALELKKENFGKIQQSFSEVHRVRELLKLGESVCLLKFNSFQVEVQGTGFLLFDNFILTNAHLFEMCTDLPRDKWREHVKITATFNYENLKSHSNNKEFTAKLYSGCDIGLDYAILELNETETQEAELPEGLLSKFAFPPKDGEACLLGHPAGAVKKIDPTCIIEKKDREQAVNQNLEEYRDYIFTLCAINQEIRKDPYADVYVTYNSFMYHGSSGSPVFDAHGRVFGLHSGGFFFDFIKPNESVIEYALPLLTIFENFVNELKKTGQEEMLVRVQEAAKGNPYLEQIIDRLNAVEPMETN